MKINNGCGIRINIDPCFSDSPEVNHAVETCESIFADMGLAQEGSNVFSIELSNESDCAEGGYLLEVDPSINTVLVLASDAEGARCGLYAFLEYLGVRWLLPGRPPILPDLPIELSEHRERKSPSFPYRGLHICSGTHHFDSGVGEWMNHIKMNRKLTHREEMRVLRNELSQFGIKPDTTVHSYEFLISDEAYFDEHPEWFPLVGGKRIRHGEGGQLCLSNSAMREEFTRNIARAKEDSPDTPIVGICPCDGFGWCECENCLALDTENDRRDGTINGRIADFVFEICQQVEKIDSSILLGHYSYSNFKDFLLEKEEFPPNLLACVTLFRCFRHSIDDSACEINRENYLRLRQISSRVSHVYVYEYYMHNWGAFPVPTCSIIARDMKAYHALGIDGFITEVFGAASREYEVFHLPLYVVSRLLYDVSEDVDEIVRDYSLKRFGPASALMVSYQKELEKGLLVMDGCLYGRPAYRFDDFFTPSVIEKASPLLDAALEVAGDFEKEVAIEKKLFDEWCDIREERARYRAPESVVVLPFSDMAIDDLPDNAAALTMLDSKTLIPHDEWISEVFVFSDAGKIGFIVDCRESLMGRLKGAKGNSVNSILSGDNLELFLSTNVGAKKCYHILISPYAEYALCECENTVWNWSWEADFHVESRRFDNGWRIMFSITKRSIGSAGPFAFSWVRNRHMDGWEIAGLPEGGAYFRINNYCEVEK